MTDTSYKHNGDTNPLLQVHEGMKVYDSEGKSLGRVERVYVGAAGDAAQARGAEPQGLAPADVQEQSDTFLNDLMRGVAGDDDLPDVVRNRLLYNGYIRISGGLLGRDRYVDRNQIASVSDDRVMLSVVEDEVLKH